MSSTVIITEPLYFDSLQWSFGKIHVVVGPHGLERIFLIPVQWQQFRLAHAHVSQNHVVCAPFVKEIAEYLAGQRTAFSMPLAFHGTPFQQQVWQQLQAIPYGGTSTYGEIARTLGRSQAARAIGQANRCNPLPIVIPCHRVIGKDGNLSGYLGQHVDIKRFLLALERQAV